MIISINLPFERIGFQNPIQRSLDKENIIKITNICKNNLYIKKFMTNKYMNSRYHIYFRKYFIEYGELNNDHKKMELFVSDFMNDRRNYPV